MQCWERRAGAKARPARPRAWLRDSLPEEEGPLHARATPATTVPCSVSGSGTSPRPGQETGVGTPSRELTLKVHVEKLTQMDEKEIESRASDAGRSTGRSAGSRKVPTTT